MLPALVLPTAMPHRLPPLRLALLVLALVAAAPAQAQRPAGGPPAAGAPQGGAITGRVLDAATGEALPAATVALYQSDAFVTGTATADDGTFALDRLPPGAYTVRISVVGYDEATQAADVRVGAPVALGEVRLAPATAQLGEVGVEGQREAVEQQADRTVYNVADQPVTSGGSAVESLQTLPSVEVDTDGNVSLRGNQNVAIHVNGRPVPVRGAALAALLRQIPANNIQRVEVIPNPSARYEANQMGGIINIVMKEGTSRGLGGGLTVGGGTAPSGELAGNVSYQQGRVDATASYGFRYDSFDLEGDSRRTIGTTDPRTTLQDFEATNGFASHLATASLDYTLRPGLNATANGQFSVRDGNTDNVSVDFVDAPGDASRTRRLTDGGNAGINADLAVGLRRQWEPQKHELTLELRGTRNTSNDDDAFSLVRLGADGGPLADSLLSRNDVAQTTDEGYGQLDYVRPLGGGRVEAGAKATRRQFDNELVYEDFVGGQYVPDPDRTNSSVYDETVLAAYAQAAHPVGPVELQAGLRAERTDRAFTLETTGDTFERAHTDLFPSAFASYTLSPGTLVKASYSRRINRPRPQQLNPFTSFEDPLNVRRGNPELGPEYTDAFELTLQYKYALTATPFYRRTTDVIRPRLTVDEATGVSTFTFENLDSDESYGADLTLAAALGQRLRGFASGSVYRSVTDGGNVESGLASDALGWSARASVQAQLRPGTDLQLFGFYRAPLEVPGGRISGFGIATLGLSQKLLADRATLSLRVNDVLSTSRFEYATADDNYEFVGVRDPDIRQVNLAFTYTFGQAPRRAPRRATPQTQPAQDDGFGF